MSHAGSRARPASYHSNVNKTLIHQLIHEHDFCPSPVRLISIGCGGEDDDSHDSMLIHASASYTLVIVLK